MRSVRYGWKTFVAIFLGSFFSVLCQGIMYQSSASTTGFAAQKEISCADIPKDLRVGESVPGANLSEIDFSSATKGVGITASQVECNAGEHEIGTRRFPVRIVVTTDGGRIWNVQGRSAPPNIAGGWGAATVSLAFESPDRYWVAANGRLDETTDGGQTWRVIHLDGTAPVVALQRSQIGIVAVTSAPAFVWKLTNGANAWTKSAPIPTSVPAPGRAPLFQVVIGPQDSAIVATSAYGDSPATLVGTRDAGTTWQVLQNPCARAPWLFIATMAQTPDSQIAILCGSGGGAGSGTRGFYTSDNYGMDWSAQAVDSNLGGADPSGLPIIDSGDVLSARPGEFLLNTANNLSHSMNGGKNWSTVFSIDSGGEVGRFDALSSTHIWLLIPSVGIYATEEGAVWHRI